MSECICGVWVCTPEHRAGQAYASVCTQLRCGRKGVSGWGTHVWHAYMGICACCVVQRCDIVAKGP